MRAAPFAAVFQEETLALLPAVPLLLAESPAASVCFSSSIRLALCSSKTSQVSLSRGRLAADPLIFKSLTRGVRPALGLDGVSKAFGVIAAALLRTPFAEGVSVWPTTVSYLHHLHSNASGEATHSRKVAGPTLCSAMSAACRMGQHLTLPLALRPYFFDRLMSCGRRREVSAAALVVSTGPCCSGACE